MRIHLYQTMNLVKENQFDQLSSSSRPLLDHLAAELAKEYVRLMKQSTAADQLPNEEKNSCVLQFTPATVQKVNVKRA